MPAEVGAPKTARPPVHLLAQQLGELSKNLGRLLLGERVLAVAELAPALPPSRRRWCWWEMIPEIRRHNGYTRAASGCAASTCNDGALLSAAPLPREPAWGSKVSEAYLRHASSRTYGGWDECWS